MNAHMFWGKISLSQDGEILDSHPIEGHSIDVAAVVLRLLAERNTRRRLAKAGGLEDLTAVQISRLAAIAFWHDVGKVNTGFTARFYRDADKPEDAGHVTEAFALFAQPLDREFMDAIGLDDMTTWFRTAKLVGGQAAENAVVDMLLAGFSHHGRPVRLPASDAEMDRLKAAWRPWKGIDPKLGLMRMALAIRDFVPEAFTSSDPADRLPTRSHFQHMFAGLVMAADWLGSHRDIFTFGRPGDSRGAFARERAKRMLAEIGFDFDPSAWMDANAVTMDSVFGWFPNNMQKTIGELPIPSAGSLTGIESETGSGKTEAAILRFLKLYVAGVVSGLYFALPTRTSAVQIHGRVAKAVKRLFGDKAPPVVLGVPGYLRVDDVDGKRLPGFQISWSDGKGGSRRWAAEHAKRYMIAPVVVGTIDQALMSVVRLSHAHMRSVALSRHMIVVDEVHASDTRLHTLNKKLIDWHIGMGGHAAIMSATLGAAARALYFGEDLPSIEDAINTPYPLVTFLETGSVRENFSVGRTKRAKKIAVEIKNILHNPDAVAQMALDHARKGAKVLVVRNTVDLAITTQRALEALSANDKRAPLFRVKGVPTLHHSRFSPSDRRLLDAAIEHNFGKTSPRRPIVLVATQTVEQSLDIDCDILITDLAPMDVMLQRVGRCHRHSRTDRPKGYSKPKTIVVVPEHRDLTNFMEHPHFGLGQAYPDVRILEATYRLLETRKHLDIPRENRELVERSTHPEALTAIQRELGEHWETHGLTTRGEQIAAEQEARHALLDYSTTFGEEANFQGEINEELRIRLGDLDSVIKIDRRHFGPFGNRIEQLTIPGWMARIDPANPDEAPEILEASPGYLRFRFGYRTERRRLKKPIFVYSRVGLELDGTADLEDVTPTDNKPRRHLNVK